MNDDVLGKIEHLVRLKFPGADEALRVSGADDDYEAVLRELRLEVEAYRSKLERMPEDDLDLLIEAEEVRVQQQAQINREENEEAQRFFNRPGARADFAVWALFPSWTLDQATALILWRDPAVVKWERVEEHLQVSSFARRYAHTRERLKVGDIVFPAPPTAFVNWAEQSGLTIPAELAACVRANPSPVTADTGLKPDSEPTVTMTAGGSSVQAAMEAMRALWRDEKPNGVKGHGYIKVNAWLKERNRDTVSESTCKRAWNKLYGPSRRGRPRSDLK
ncbi:hypothetical protein [Methylobacterium nigriterrae]|uniref:hypothetical protein n=1 Tax=Methylobacterium nigriterrae TaxID=3127512 RepID=UPI00301340B7